MEYKVYFQVEMMSRICLEYTEFYLVVITFSKPQDLLSLVQKIKYFLQPWMVFIGLILLP